jgi:hypothetical protein
MATYYRRGKYADMTGPEARAIAEAVSDHTLVEALAPEMAAVAEGNNLIKGFGGNASERAYSAFAQASSFMFGMTEQMNRRITFRAAWNLAMKNQGAGYLTEAVKSHPLLYESLLRRGWSEQEARSYVAAKDAVEQTQFVHSRWAQPAFLRGRLRTVFIFKSFLYNTLFMLWNYPSASLRSLLTLGALGGLMAIPGAEDIADLVKLLGYQLFGNDWDVEREGRKLLLDHAKGIIKPDLVLHGLSRGTLGFPGVLDMLGHVGGIEDPVVPTFDRSRAISLGRVLPVPLSPLFGPAVRSEERAISESVQNALGYAIGQGFNVYKALADSQLEVKDPKRWERMMPRSAANVSRAYRYYTEGMERTRTGAAVVKFDPYDTNHMMEMLGVSLGYQPHRLAAKWNQVIADLEVQAYWTLRKQGLLRQLDAAVRTTEPEPVKRVMGAIEKFNKDLPDYGKQFVITRDTLTRSLRLRAVRREEQELGLPNARTMRGISAATRALYPEAVDVRRPPK